MKPAPRVAVFAFVVTVALAGCLGASSDPADDGVDDDVPPTATDGEKDGETCALEGATVDDEQNIVAGANVTLSSDDVMLKTPSALDGSFSFSFVPAGPFYNLSAYTPLAESNGRTIQCVAGATEDDILLTLFSLPEPVLPHDKEEAFNGLIGCSVGTPVAQAFLADVCDRGYGNAANPGVFDAQVQKTITTEAKPNNVTGVVYEMDWEFSSMGGKHLALYFPAVLADEPIIQSNTPRYGTTYIRGASPLRIQIEGQNATNTLHTGGTSLTYTVRASGSNTTEFVANPTEDGSGGLVVNQGFHVYLTYFYNGEAIPEGFTRLSPQEP